MYFLELLDVHLFIKCLKTSDPSFPVLNVASFFAAPTRSACSNKLVPQHCLTMFYQHSYSPHQEYPPSNWLLSLQSNVKQFFWSYFVAYFNPGYPCTSHISCPYTKGHHILNKINFHWVSSLYFLLIFVSNMPCSLHRLSLYAGCQ